MSYFEDCLNSNIFHQILSFIKGIVPSNIIFPQRSNSIKAYLKKVWLVQIVLANIFSEILLFWEDFHLLLLYIWLRMEGEDLTIKKIGWMKAICGRKMKTGELRMQNWGSCAVDWRWFHHVTQPFIEYSLDIFCCNSHYFEDIV